MYIKDANFPYETYTITLNSPQISSKLPSIPFSVAMSIEDLTTREFDYVICGGGTAGLVIAARLTEDPNVTVAVLEAGGNGLGDLMIDAPNLATQLYDKPQDDWAYKTVLQVSCRNLHTQAATDRLSRSKHSGEFMAGPEERF
jgi:hypothetical protein